MAKLCDANTARANSPRQIAPSSKARYKLVGVTLGIKTNGGGFGKGGDGPSPGTCSSAGPSDGISLLKSFVSLESPAVSSFELSCAETVFAARSPALLAG